MRNYMQIYQWILAASIYFVRLTLCHVSVLYPGRESKREKGNIRKGTVSDTSKIYWKFLWNKIINMSIPGLGNLLVSFYFIENRIH